MRRVLCTACQKLTRKCLVGDNYHVVLPSATAGEAAVEDITIRSEQDSNDDEVPYVFL